MSNKTGMTQTSARVQNGSKKREIKICNYYIIKDGKITRRLKKCPRCGAFMAFHKSGQQRWACGSCSYTQFMSGSTG
ncbi:MAG: 30S ribosomal protein S27ae [Candidatus Bathyarchaeia archaeon]